MTGAPFGQDLFGHGLFSEAGDLAAMSASDVARALNLAPHPEGGRFRETFRDPREENGRSVGSGMLLLLEAGEHAHWHRVDVTEVWHFHTGGPLALTLSPNGHDAEAHRLGLNLGAGERPQVTVPAGVWQTAESLGRWTLVGCTAAPAFDFAGFELAPDDWYPKPRSTP